MKDRVKREIVINFMNNELTRLHYSLGVQREIYHDGLTDPINATKNSTIYNPHIAEKILDRITILEDHLIDIFKI